jgi:hypothetical protein
MRAGNLTTAVIHRDGMIPKHVRRASSGATSVTRKRSARSIVLTFAWTRTMTNYLLTMTKGELFNIIVGLMVLLTVVTVVMTPEARKLVVGLLTTKPYADGSSTEDKIWSWVVVVLILLTFIGMGLMIARVIVEIVSWIVTAVYSPT